MMRVVFLLVLLTYWAGSVKIAPFEIKYKAVKRCKDEGKKQFGFSNFSVWTNQRTTLLNVTMDFKKPLDDSTQIVIRSYYTIDGNKNVGKPIMYGGFCKTMKTMCPSFLQKMMESWRTSSCHFIKGTHEVNNIDVTVASNVPLPLVKFSSELIFEKNAERAGCIQINGESIESERS